MSNGGREGGTQGDSRMEDEQEVVKGSSRWVGLVYLVPLPCPLSSFWNLWLFAPANISNMEFVLNVIPIFGSRSVCSSSDI